MKYHQSLDRVKQLRAEVSAMKFNNGRVHSRYPQTLDEVTESIQEKERLAQIEEELKRLQY